MENGSTVAELVDGMRKTEKGDLIRLGIVSGEFFGKHVCTTALELGADFGWDMTERMFQPVPDWIVSMVNLGYLHPIELELRGREIVLSAEMAQKRLELLDATSSPSSRFPEDRGPADGEDPAPRDRYILSIVSIPNKYNPL